MEATNFKSLIVGKYTNSCRVILGKLSSKRFWNTCSTDNTGEQIYLVAFSNHPNYSWGVLNLNEVEENWLLLKTEILYLIPVSPTFENFYLEEGYPEPLYGYQPSPQERYHWTVNLARIISAWLMGAMVYEITSLPKQDRFECISKALQEFNLIEACSILNFSAKDCELEWENKFHSFLINKEVIVNKVERLNYSISIGIEQICTNHIKHCEQIIEALYSWELWNTCNTYERGQYLFFMVSIDSQISEWNLVDIEDQSTYQEITDVIPGLVEVPYPPTFRCTNSPVVGYQPTPKERYEWTLELAKRLDAWLAAIISYSTNTFSWEDKLKVHNLANSALLSENCFDWKFTQSECNLNWGIR